MEPANKGTVIRGTDNNVQLPKTSRTQIATWQAAERKQKGKGELIIKNDDVSRRGNLLSCNSLSLSLSLSVFYFPVICLLGPRHDVKTVRWSAAVPVRK